MEGDSIGHLACHSEPVLPFCLVAFFCSHSIIFSPRKFGWLRGEELKMDNDVVVMLFFLLAPPPSGQILRVALPFTGLKVVGEEKQ